MAVTKQQQVKELERRADLARRVVLPEDVKAWRAEHGAAPSLLTQILLALFVIFAISFVRLIDAYDEEASREPLTGRAIAFLDPSAYPATLSECARAYPRRPYPEGAISFAQGLSGAYQARACYWDAPRKGA